VGIDRLISEEVFTAAYPLHESLGLRQILHEYWSKWSCWRCYQPLDHIREYFGEKIALYFAWIGFYTAWLLPASLIGTLVFLLVSTEDVICTCRKELCESKDSFIMCPLCDICSTWNYSSICFTYKVPVSHLAFLEPASVWPKQRRGQLLSELRVFISYRHFY
uniref:Anoctamin n=1 Tax=Xiphophorus maculatus TaxID=8083 RepID=A0A3B5QTP5_XIPMA